MERKLEDTCTVPKKPEDTGDLENCTSQGDMCKSKKPMPIVKETMFRKQYANPESFNFKMARSMEYVKWAFHMGPETREVKGLSPDVSNEQQDIL